MSCGSTLSSRPASRNTAMAWLSAVRVPSPFAWIRVLKHAHDRWQQRQALLDLDDRLLDDIGITRKQAEREASKPFWQ